MLYGVFSDVHSNLEALGVVLDFFERSGVEAHVCCGDMVGYGPNPNECLERIRALPRLSAIVGNHDLGAIGRMELTWFNRYARAAAQWTAGVLSGPNRAFLEGLTARLETPDFTLAHGTPRSPADEYLLTSDQFRDNAPMVRRWPLFTGHTHMPMIFRFDEGGKAESRFLDDRPEALPVVAGGSRGPVALNPGSVGQPRDHDPRAACGLYDSKKGTFRVVRHLYDVPAVQAKIRAAGLPEYLAQRLDSGQ